MVFFAVAFPKQYATMIVDVAEILNSKIARQRMFQAGESAEKQVRYLSSVVPKANFSIVHSVLNDFIQCPQEIYFVGLK